MRKVWELTGKSGGLSNLAELIAYSLANSAPFLPTNRQCTKFKIKGFPLFRSPWVPPVLLSNRGASEPSLLSFESEIVEKYPVDHTVGIRPAGAGNDPGLAPGDWIDDHPGDNFAECGVFVPGDESSCRL